MAVLVPLALLVVAETGLRLFGYGYSKGFFARSRDGKNLEVNEDFARQFYPARAARGKTHPFLVPVHKQPGTLRIFILGESAALGTPEPSFGFARILEVMLRLQHPGQRFEVINAAMRGVNSHIILPIARDCAEHDPDLFILYVGNNEMVGLHAPGPDRSSLHQNLAFIRAARWIRSLKAGQLLAAAIESRSSTNAPGQDMAFFRERRCAFNDPRRAAIARNFRINLEDICRVVAGSGAKAVLSTVPVNLRDFPPLGSMHRPGLDANRLVEWETAYTNGMRAELDGRHQAAIEHYKTASQLDAHFAELHFRFGRCFEAAGKAEDARRHYLLARDSDALPFRADSRINDAIREVGAARREAGLVLVDAERAFESSDLTANGIPGAGLFRDHVHMNFDGDCLLARIFYPVVAAALGLQAATGDALPSRRECAAALAYTAWDELQADASVVAGMAFPPYLDQLEHTQRQSQADQAIKNRRQRLTQADLRQVVAMYTAALARAPDDWQLHHNFGKFCFTIGDFRSAAEHLAIEAGVFPGSISSRMGYGVALMRAGRTEDAIAQFDAVLRIDPACEPARKALESIMSRRSAPGS